MDINDDDYQENKIKIKDLNDTILLIHLKNVDEKEEKKEIFDENEKLKEESLKKYYKIENDKNKEIENFFKNSRSKVKIENASILSNNTIYTISKENIIKLYDINDFKELYTINCKYEGQIYSVIDLDNKDLIISVSKIELLVYRLENKNYHLFQTIYELTGKLRRRIKGFYQKSPIYSKYEIIFELYKIKKLTNNRFMSVSNYEIKLYSLNKTNSYEVILLYNDYYNDYIYEFDDENYLIIDYINEHFDNYFNLYIDGYNPHIYKREVVIKTIKLNTIKETEKEKILNDNKKK